MKTQTFVVGCALALALLLFAQRHPQDSQPTGFRSVVDLTNSDGGMSSATMLKAPAHLAPELWTLDQIPPERLVAPLVVLDVTARASHDPDYQVSVKDIARWEESNGQIPLGAVVIVRTGRDLLSTAEGDRHVTGYSQDAVQFLIEGRQIRGLGIDTPSKNTAMDSVVDRYVLAHSVYSLENVANLGQVPVSGAAVVVAPAKLKSGTGPVRVLALVH